MLHWSTSQAMEKKGIIYDFNFIKHSSALLTRAKQKLSLSSFKDVGAFINMPSKIIFLKSHEKKIKNTQPEHNISLSTLILITRILLCRSK